MNKSVENILSVDSSLVDSLFQELVGDFQHFKSYYGFKKWLSVIPDELLTQLVDRLIQSSHITPPE